jgi:phosphatidylserine synthase
MRVNPALFLPLMAEYAAPTWAILISGFFMLLSVSLSMYLIFQHLSAYNNPEEQKFVLGVILMVPCYAVESVISPKQLLFFFVGLGLFRYFSCVFDDLCFSSATVCFIGKS